MRVKQAQAKKILLRPAGLHLDDASQGAKPKSFGRTMEGKRYATTIRMEIMAVAALLPPKRESISEKTVVEMASRDRAQPRVVGHYTFTATLGSSATPTLSGNGSPASNRSSTTI